MKGPFGRVMAANFFFFLNFAAFFLLPLYVRSMGGSEGTVGIAMGISGLASMLSLPFTFGSTCPLGLEISRVPGPPPGTTL